MNWRVAAVALAGLAAAAGLLLSNDVATIGAGLRTLGILGFATVILLHLLPITLCALAWRSLLQAPRPGIGGMLWARLVRDAGGDLIGFVPAAGEMLSIRALALKGVGALRGAAAVVVDLSMELAGQLAFTVIGLALLLAIQPGGALVDWAIAGVVLMLPALIGFVLAQRLGLFRLLERLPHRLAGDLGLKVQGGAAGLHAAIDVLWRDQPRIWRAGAMHLSAWLLGAGEAWACLALIGVTPGLDVVIVVESLVFALRAVAFFVPGALGVQEGGYIALFAAFGLPAETALTLALVKRGRELALGVPVLASWQLLEARRRRLAAVQG